MAQFLQAVGLETTIPLFVVLCSCQFPHNHSTCGDPSWSPWKRCQVMMRSLSVTTTWLSRGTLLQPSQLWPKKSTHTQTQLVSSQMSEEINNGLLLLESWWSWCDKTNNLTPGWWSDNYLESFQVTKHIKLAKSCKFYLRSSSLDLGTDVKRIT